MTDIVEVMARGALPAFDDASDFVQEVARLTAKNQLASLQEAGFAVVPVEPTEAMDELKDRLRRVQKEQLALHRPLLAEHIGDAADRIERLEKLLRDVRDEARSEDGAGAMPLDILATIDKELDGEG